MTAEFAGLRAVVTVEHQASGSPRRDSLSAGSTGTALAVDGGMAGTRLAS